MPTVRSLPLVVLLVFAGPAVAAPPVVPQGEDGGHDEILVIARSVMPRVAYRGLEPDQNVVRVQSTIFPGRVFHATLDGLLGTLVGDQALDESAAPPVAGAPRFDRPLAADAAELGPGARGGAGAAPVGGSATVGGAVLRATGGIADTITAATMRASQVGGGR